MFEFRTAISYLIPRKGQLSTSVVGLIAVLVILAITWLILVFFSTTEGYESRWSEKIVGVVGPMRIVPTPEYFESPFYQLDLYSNLSSFSPQRLSQKSKETTLPYDPSSDPPLPQQLQKWLSSHSHRPHPVASIVSHLNDKKIPWRFFESTVCHLSIPALESSPSHSLSQYTCLLGLDAIDQKALVTIHEITASETERFLALLQNPLSRSSPAITSFAASLGSIEIILSKDADALHLKQGVRLSVRLVFEKGVPCFALPTNTIPINELSFAVISASVTRPLALPTQGTLSYVPSLGYPTILPKQLRQSGARLFDTGTFQFSGVGLEGNKTLTIPFFIAGFFDSGILPIGGKLAITSRQAVIAIQPELISEGPMATSGIIIDKPIPSLQQEIDAIAPGLFVAQTYDKYEATEELYQQLASEKTLFRLLSIIIIAVACSNIFSMLFILAHDRRKEIAVLRALGASKSSITAIFLIAGLGVGLFGSILGSALAALTLHYLPEILSIIGTLQGHAVLSQGIYGEISSQSLSLPTLLFAFSSISLTSALAGTFAAIRACKMNVSEALRS